jgi:hypothetical protein
MGILVSAGAKGRPAAPAPPPAPPEASRGPGPLALLLAGLALLGALGVAGGVLFLVARLQPHGGTDSPGAAVTPAPEPPPEPTPAPQPESRPAAPAPRSATADARPRPEEPTPEVSLPEKEQERVNKAIDRGVAYVKGRLQHGARGELANRLGGQALAGLTLLACGVPAKDPVVRQITTRVRDDAETESQTYDLALSILFLDRLGERQDRELIRDLAMRLVAGQDAAGGWTYNCLPLGSKERERLMDALEALPVEPAGGDGPVRGTRPEAGRAAKSGKNAVRTRSDELSPALKNLPVLRFKPGEKLSMAGGGDNSNTQFALMALWVARKYGAPVDRTLAMVAARFRSSQNADGSWGYHGRAGQYADSMTCAGLLGLAVGRGSAGEGTAKGAAQDPDVAHALHYLGQHVGAEAHDAPGRTRGTGHFFGANAHGDLYFLWSVERVAVAYDLRTIEGKDWYGWGAHVLLEHQAGDGGWHDVFAGLPDTCFALLFLKRVNVAQDLTATLRSIGSGAGGQRSVGQVPPK